VQRAVKKENESACGGGGGGGDGGGGGGGGGGDGGQRRSLDQAHFARSCRPMKLFVTRRGAHRAPAIITRR
jgi:hypothetical protein